MTSRSIDRPLQRQIERWFIARGVPQLIEGYTAERRMDTRAVPFVFAWLILGTLLFWGTRPDWSPLLNGVGVLGTLAFIGLGVTVVQRSQRRWLPGRALPAYFVLGLGLLVAIPAAVVHASLLDGVRAGVDALLGIAMIWVVIGLGLAEIAWWGLRRLESELLQIVGLLSTTLPVLLILVFFLLFAAEIWEAAHLLATVELWAVLALVALVAAVLVVSAMRAEMRTIDSADAATLRTLALETPAAPLVDGSRLGVAPPLSLLQRLNLQALAVIAQLVQSLFVALLVTGFLILFGIIALPVELQERWIGEPVTSLMAFELLGEARALSMELLTVTAMLGAIVGLYFTGLAVTDSAYRPAHFGRIVDEVWTLVAARRFYAAAVSPPPPLDSVSGGGRSAGG